MHLLQFVVALYLSAGVFGLLKRDTNATFSYSNRFIVEISDGINLDDIVRDLQNQGATILQRFTSKIFTGLSIRSPTGSLETLTEFPGIENAWVAHTARLTALDGRADPAPSDLSTPLYSNHQWTGVDKAHANGILGKGVIVAVVDSGIEYTHPALGGCFGPGCKVVGGYDLVGNGNWPISGNLTPDADPLDQIGHGTHVAGIISGKTDTFTGVAPEATLLAYKVASSVDANVNHDVIEEILIEAYLAAYDADADVITTSLGWGDGFSDGAWATVASRLVDQGVIVTIAAANDGLFGPFYASSGASGKNVLAIANSLPKTFPMDAFNITVSVNGINTTTELGFLKQGDGPWKMKDWPIIPLSLDTTADQACDHDILPSEINATDVSRIILLVRRADPRSTPCNVYEQVLHLISSGAKWIMFYNQPQFPLNYPYSPSSKDNGMNLSLIESQAGLAIIEAYKANGEVYADFSSVPATYKLGGNQIRGFEPSDTSSWGGLYDLQIKSDIAAPGAYIFSAWLNNTWAIKSGTSMAAPYVAGIAALYVGLTGGRKVHGPGFAKQAVDRIISSGTPMAWSTSSSLDYVRNESNARFDASVMQTGGGHIDAWKVLNYTTQLTYEKFALNDTKNFVSAHSVNITNNGKDSLEYSFSIQPGSSGFNAHNPRFLGDELITISTPQNIFPYDLSPAVTFPAGKFEVNPGETKTAGFTFTPPSGAVNTTALPFYSGRVLIQASNGESFVIPYLGAAFDLSVEFRDMFEAGFPLALNGPDREGIDTYHSFAFNVSLEAQDFPKVAMAPKWGVTQLRWDIYEANWDESKWSYPPKAGENGYIGSAATYADSDYGDFDPSTMDVNKTVAFPRARFPRSNYNAFDPIFWWMGKLANGSWIQPGQYTWRFAALVPFGDPVKTESWSIWKTPQITITAQPISTL